MIFGELNNIGSEPETEHSDKTRNIYESPTLTILDTLDIETGSMNVPENSNGLLES